MKILFIIPRFLPEIGGVEKHTCKVAQELVNSGNSVTVITTTKRKNVPLLEKLGKIQIFRFSSLFDDKKSFIVVNLIKSWFFIFRNFKLLRKYDVIHIHDYQTFLWVFPFLLFVKKPIYITFHGFEGYPISKSAKLIRKMAEQSLDGSICVGNFIFKWYGTQTEYVTIGGVEIPNAPLSDVDDTAVYIGRLTHDTGILDLIEALRTLKEKYNFEIPLHICGDGPLYPVINNYAEKYGLEVFMHGFVTEPQKYLTSCRYAFVSGYLSILEAMSFKRPVFTFYNNPLKRDYLYSFPHAEKLMVIASSPEDLAEKLYTSIRNPSYIHSLVKNAYAFACQQTWREVSSLYLKLYNQGD